jgi:hypothetical protein
MLDFLLRKQEAKERVISKYACSHPDQILTRFVCTNNAIQFVMQCTACKARVGSPISHNKLSRKQKDNAPLFDEDGRAARREEISYQYAMNREKFNSARWWAEYTKYLASDEWKNKRSRVMARDNKRCTEQRPGCTKQADEVHHLSYKNVGNEPMEDLTAVCHHCHELITEESRREWRTL